MGRQIFPKPNEAEVGASTLADKSLEECLVQRALGWKFPKPAGGGSVTVAYPFVFGNEKIEDGGIK